MPPAQGAGGQKGRGSRLPKPAVGDGAGAEPEVPRHPLPHPADDLAHGEGGGHGADPQALHLAQVKHYTRAAQQLCISQPSLSHAIRQLEGELGVPLFEKTGRNTPAKKLLLNPGVIGLAAGLLVFLLSIPVPEVVAAPIGHLAALNTPVPMLIIGFYLAETNLPAALRDKRSYVAIGLRLVALPLLALFGMVLCGMRGPLLISCVIAVSAPVAAASTMFATKFGQDTLLSVNLVSLSTLFSVVTMPLIVAVAQFWG